MVDNLKDSRVSRLSALTGRRASVDHGTTGRGYRGAGLDGSVTFIGKSALDLVRFRQTCSYLTARHKSSCQRDPHLFKSKGMRSSRSGESFDRKRQLFILLCFDLRPLETKVERGPKRSVCWQC